MCVEPHFQLLRIIFKSRFLTTRALRKTMFVVVFEISDFDSVCIDGDFTSTNVTMVFECERFGDFG